MKLLSICIPTYNRYRDLELSLKSIIRQDKFLKTNSIEIIVCDNHSTDKTKEIALKFCERYPDKIFYYQNSSNIGPAKNLEKCLSYGTGIYLKISNDTNIYIDGALDYIIDLVKDNAKTPTTLFFANSVLKSEKNKSIDNLDEFIRNVSFYSTWIVGFGIYRSKLKKIKSFKVVETSNLINDILFQDIIGSEKVIICNREIITINNPKVKSGYYNFYEVFIDHYLRILKLYKSKGFIRARTLFLEKHRLFIQHIIPFSIAIFVTKKALFGTKNWLKIIFTNFVFHPVLYLGIPLFIVKRIIKKF